MALYYYNPHTRRWSENPLTDSPLNIRPQPRSDRVDDPDDVGRSEDPWGDDPEVIEDPIDQEEAPEETLPEVTPEPPKRPFGRLTANEYRRITTGSLLLGDMLHFFLELTPRDQRRVVDDPDDIGRSEDAWGDDVEVVEPIRPDPFADDPFGRGRGQRVPIDADDPRDDETYDPWGAPKRVADDVEVVQKLIVGWSEYQRLTGQPQQRIDDPDDIGRSEDAWGDDVEVVEKLLKGWEEYQQLTGAQPTDPREPTDRDDPRDDATWDPWGAPKVAVDVDDELTPEIIETIYYAKLDADPLSLTYLEYDIVYGRLRPDVGGGATGGPGGRLPQEGADTAPDSRLLETQATSAEQAMRAIANQVAAILIRTVPTEVAAWITVLPSEDGQGILIGSNTAFSDDSMEYVEAIQKALLNAQTLIALLPDSLQLNANLSAMEADDFRGEPVLAIEVWIGTLGRGKVAVDDIFDDDQLEATEGTEGLADAYVNPLLLDPAWREARGITEDPATWTRAVWDAFRAGIDLFGGLLGPGMAFAQGQVKRGLIPHPLAATDSRFHGVFLDPENGYRRVHPDGSPMAWSYLDTTIQARVPGTDVIIKGEPADKEGITGTDKLDLRPLDSDELTWLPEFAREYVFKNKDGEYVDQNGTPVFLWPWEWKLKSAKDDLGNELVDVEGEPVPWVAMFFRGLFSSELQLASMLGVDLPWIFSQDYAKPKDVTSEDVEFYIKRYRAGGYDYLKNLPEYGQMITDMFNRFDNGGIDELSFVGWLKSFTEVLAGLDHDVRGDVSFEELDLKRLEELEDWTNEHMHTFRGLRPDQVTEYIHRWDQGEFKDKLPPGYLNTFAQLLSEGKITGMELAGYLYVLELMEERKVRRDYGLAETEEQVRNDPVLIAQYMERIKLGDFDELIARQLKTGDRAAAWSALSDEEKAVALWRWEVGEAEKGRFPTITLQYNDEQVKIDANNLADIAKQIMWDHAAGRNTKYELGPSIDIESIERSGVSGFRVRAMNPPPRQLPSPPDFGKKEAEFGDDFHAGENLGGRDLDELEADRRANLEVLSVWREMERYRVGVEIALQTVEETKETLPTRQRLIIRGHYLNVIYNEEDIDLNSADPFSSPSDYQRLLEEQSGGSYKPPERILWGIEIFYLQGEQGWEEEEKPVLVPEQEGKVIEIKSEEELEAEEEARKKEEERGAGKAVVSGLEDELTPEIIDKIYYAKRDDDPLSLTFLEYDIVYGRLRPGHAGGPRVGGGDTGGPGGRLPQEGAGTDPIARLLDAEGITDFEKHGENLYYYDRGLTLWFGITREGETFTVGNDESMELVRAGGTTQEVGREIDPETEIRLGSNVADFYQKPGLYIDGHYYYYNAFGSYGAGPGWYGEFENKGDGSSIITRATRVGHGGMIPFPINIIAPPRTQLPDDSTPGGRRERAELFSSLPKNVYYNPVIGEFVRAESNGQHLIQRDWTEFTLGETRPKAITNFKRQLGYDPFMLYGQDVGPEFIYADAEVTYELQGDPYYYDEAIGHWIAVRSDGQKMILTGGPPPDYYYNEITGISFHQGDDGQWYGRNEEGRVFLTDDTGFPIDPETGEHIDWQKPVNVRKDYGPQPYYYSEDLGVWIITNPNLPEGYEFSFRPPEGYYYNSITKLAFSQAEDGTWYGRDEEGRLVITDDTGFPIDLQGNPVDWQEEGWIDRYWLLPGNQGIEPEEGWIDRDLGDYIPPEGLTGTITIIEEDLGPADGDVDSPRSRTAQDALFIARQAVVFLQQDNEEHYQNKKAELLAEIEKITADLEAGVYGSVDRIEGAKRGIKYRQSKLRHLYKPITLRIRWTESPYAGLGGEQLGYEIIGTGGIAVFWKEDDEGLIAEATHHVILGSGTREKLESFVALIYQEREERLEAMGNRLPPSANLSGGRSLPKYNIWTYGFSDEDVSDNDEEQVVFSVSYHSEKWEEPLGYDPNAFEEFKPIFDNALIIARAVQQRMARVLREEGASHLTPSIVTTAVRGPFVKQPDDAEIELRWFGYSVGSMRKEIANEFFEAYNKALYEGAEEANLMAQSLSPGLITVGIGENDDNELETVNIFILASSHIDIVDFNVSPLPLPEDKPLPTGEAHSEYDPGFDLPEIGDALYIAEYVADVMRSRVRLSQLLSTEMPLENTIVIRPEYANEGIRYLIGSNHSAANDSPEYTAAIQAALLAANEVAQSREVAEFMKLNLSSMVPDDDPSNPTLAIEIWFGLEYDEETEAWRAVRPRDQLIVSGQSRLRNIAMKEVVDFAVRILKQECPVRTGTMRNSISPRQTDANFKGNITTYFDVGARVQYSRFVASYRSAVDRAVAATQAYAAQYPEIRVHPALIELPSGPDKYGAGFGPGMVIEFGESLDEGFWKDFHFGVGSFDLINPAVVNWLFGLFGEDPNYKPGDFTPPGLPGGSGERPDDLEDEDDYDDDDEHGNLPFHIRF